MRPLLVIGQYDFIEFRKWTPLLTPQKFNKEHQIIKRIHWFLEQKRDLPKLKWKEIKIV